MKAAYWRPSWSVVRLVLAVSPDSTSRLADMGSSYLLEHVETLLALSHCACVHLVDSLEHLEAQLVTALLKQFENVGITQPVNKDMAASDMTEPCRVS